VREFLDWQKAREVVRSSTSCAAARGDPRHELDKAKRPHRPPHPEQDEAIEAATTAIVNKLLHSPTVHLKEAARESDAPSS